MRFLLPCDPIVPTYCILGDSQGSSAGVLSVALAQVPSNLVSSSTVTVVPVSILSLKMRSFGNHIITGSISIFVEVVVRWVGFKVVVGEKFRESSVLIH